MSETEFQFPDYEVDRGFWLDLEVPFQSIIDDWDRTYYDEVVDRLEDGRMDKRTLQLYYLITDFREIPDDEKTAFDLLIDHDAELGYNICAQLLFSQRKNVDIIKKYIRKEVYHEVESTPLSSIRHGAYSISDKVTMIALIQLYSPNKLRDVLALDNIKRTTPSSTSSLESGEKWDKEEEIQDTIKRLETNEDQTYSHWHSFSYQSKDYFVIKRKIRDSVERQPIQNQEEEPAEFVTIIFDGSDMRVYSQKKKTAAETQGALDESDGIDVSSPDVDVSRERAETTVNTLVEHDRQEDTDIRITGLKVKSSTLTNQPEIQIKSKRGVSSAINELKQDGYNLLRQIDDIESIFLRIGDSKQYRVYPEENSSNDEYTWQFRCTAQALSDEDRERFKSEIGNLVDVDFVFAKR